MITVIIPTRLAVHVDANMDAPGGMRYLDSALSSVMVQSHRNLITQIVIAVDPGQASAVPERFTETSRDWVTPEVVEGEKASQASVLNAALRATRNEWVAFLEDDDQWRPRKLGEQEPFMATHDFISCNQLEVSPDGGVKGVNDFPTPSGWLVKRACLGLFDESFRWHIDTERLGHLNANKAKRVHLVAPGTGTTWLVQVQKHSETHYLTGQPLVVRMVNPDGGMGQIRKGGEAAAQSKREHEIMVERYGSLPW